MTKTIIINRPLSEAETEDIRLMAEEGAVVYSLSRGEELDFARPLTLDAEEKRSINYRVMDQVLQFGDLPAGDKTIAELLHIDNASMWHYQKFRIYFTVRNLMYFVQPIQANFTDFANHRWYVATDTGHLRRLFPQVEFVYPEEGNKDSFNFGILFGYAFLLLIRTLRYWLAPKSKARYLIYLTEKYSTVMDRRTLRNRSGHPLLDYLITELDNRFALLTEVLMPRSKGKSDYSFSPRQLRSTLHHRPKIFLEGFMLSGLLNKEVRDTTLTAMKRLREQYQLIKATDLDFTAQLILEVMRSLHSSSGFFLFRYFAARRFFSGSAIEAVIAGDENSPLTRSLLDAARYCNIRVIGLQHGTMHDLHPAYLYTPNDRKNQIMPDLTLTWGSYWEKFLVEKGNYPKGSVVQVGQIRTDIIPALLQAQNRKQSNPKELIVFASQPQRDPELRYQAAYDVFKAASQLPNTKLIVKLHPREFGDATYYKDIATKAGCTNYVINKTSDLYQLIASCDVLITCFSTVGTETVYFYKPLVILDHLKQDIMGYAAEGVAFQATDAQSLTTILSGIFRGTLRVDRQKYSSFIQKYAYRIDGMVARRCLDAITGERGKEENMKMRK
ncbi:MAG TPA: CDP-glycerol glycerophosphotransferase family protein [Prolixibacteraceae bacterium]|nr:CDP-glycerol glycerophosphotransferase family protein [Prolixibacteraceae bacterium]